MTYEIEFAKSASKELAKLPRPTAVRISKAVSALSLSPRNGSVRPMVGSKSWRLRVGDYRVIYDVHDKIKIISVLRIRHRREVYR